MNFLADAKGKKVTLVVGGVVITGEVHASDPSPLPGGHVTLTDASLDDRGLYKLLSIRLDRVDAWVWIGPRPSEDKGQKAKETRAKLERGRRGLEELVKKDRAAGRHR